MQKLRHWLELITKFEGELKKTEEEKSTVESNFSSNGKSHETSKHPG